MSALDRGDRVTELYRGEIFTPRSQATCRDRVHWICSRATGRRVLDVGCSQGIVSILLAHDGFEVVGIDLDPDAIAFAAAEREELPPEIRQRLELHCTDVRALPPEETGPFDTIVLGEILEHFTQPEKLLATAVAFGRADARVVVTVPFGLHPHEAHRTTFTLTRFAALVSGLVVAEELDVVDGYIRFAGRRREPGVADDHGLLAEPRLLALTEKGLLASQERLFDQLADARSRVEAAGKRIESWQSRARQAEAALSRQAEAPPAEPAREEVEGLRAALAESETARLRQDRERNELERVLAARSELLERKQKMLEEANSGLSEVRAKVRSLEAKLATLRESVSYRLGERVIRAGRSPAGMARLVVDIGGLGLRGFGRRLRRVLRPPLKAAAFKERAERKLARRGVRTAERWGGRMVEQGRISEAASAKVFFSLLKDRHLEDAVRHGERALELDPGNPALARALAARQQALGNVARAEELGILALEGSCPPNLRDGELSFSELKSRLQQVLDRDGLEGIEEWRRMAMEHGWASELKMSQVLFALTRRAHPLASLRYGERAFELAADLTVGKALLAQYRSLGQLRRAHELGLLLGEPMATPRNQDFVLGQLALLEHGFPPPDEATERLEGRPDHVLYLLHNSLPYASGGYATRSHGLACALRHAGVEVQPVTRLGFPLDLKKNGVAEAAALDVVDEVPYRRLLTRERGYGATPLPQYLRDYADAVIDLARRQRPAVLHAASNFMNGVAANYAAAFLGLPSVYEVRGLWEITRLSRQPEWGDSDQFRMLRKMETQAASDATAVIAITEALRRELIERGVVADKVFVVPNSVDPQRFVARPREAELEERLGLRGSVVFGYVGSVVDYEGLDDLFAALATLVSRRVTGFVTLIVGDGDALPRLRELARELALEEHVRFTGRVPHEEVERYYSLIDVVTYPRKPLPVCEMVSPIKPFEAMAMTKAVVASSVAALAEIVRHEETGLIFAKGDVEHLADTLATLVRHGDLRRELGERAREWVVRERSWTAAARRVREIYQQLVPLPAVAGGRWPSAG